jgi:hypothetical protein
MTFKNLFKKIKQKNGFNPVNISRPKICCLSSNNKSRFFSTSCRAKFNLTSHLKFKNGYNPNFIDVNEVDLMIQEKINNYFNFNKKASIKFDSLDYGYTQIKFRFLGVSGVYKLTSKLNPDRFYIGSSTNLARRIGEYENLTKGLRKPQSSSELEISKISASN